MKVKHEGEKETYVVINQLVQSKQISLNVHIPKARREYGSVVTVDSPHSDILHFDILNLPEACTSLGLKVPENTSYAESVLLLIKIPFE